MDFREAQDYLLSFTDYETMPAVAYSPDNYDLRRMGELLERLGNPHRGPLTVHITGTKGKGSTAAMIASVLSAAGYRPGLFTSPHLHTLRERIRVADRLISEEELAAGVEELCPHVEAMMSPPRYGALTTFELLTALAFIHFRRQEVDFQVVEVGLGGRLDATNLVQPQVAVITSISLDHQEVLGPTVEKIAAEKAGIIKPGIAVVSAPQPAAAAAVIEQACAERGARLTVVGREIHGQLRTASPEGQFFQVQGGRGGYDLFLPLLGEHQMENATVAVAALEALAEQGVKLSPQSISQGLAAVSWPGRLQVLARRPWVVVDGAHNAYSACKLRQAVQQYFPGFTILVMGTSRDKDVAGMVAELSPLRPQVIVTSSRHPRAADAVSLASEWQKHGIEAQVVGDIPQAVAQALQEAGRGDLVLATGSIFVAAEVIEYLGAEPKEYRGR